MGNRLAGRVAIVTGAGRGIGREEALALAVEGARVVVNDLGGERDGSSASRSPADEVVAEIREAGGEAVANYDSVASWAGGESIIRSALDAFGRLDILVNNAGILRDRMFFNMSEEEWDIVLKVHLYGHFYTTRHACTVFRQQRYGRIINTSSMSGLGNLGQANYAAAKEGIVGLTRTVARDMGRYGVTCNCIRPRAGTRLTLTEELKAAMAKAKESGVSSGTSAGLIDYEKFQPADVPPLVVYLATEQSASINGCVFFVGGGQISLFPEPAPVKTLYKDGRWTLDELLDIMPQSIEQGLINPSPAAPPRG